MQEKWRCLIFLLLILMQGHRIWKTKEMFSKTKIPLEYCFHLCCLVKRRWCFKNVPPAPASPQHTSSHLPEFFRGMLLFCIFPSWHVKCNVLWRFKKNRTYSFYQTVHAKQPSSMFCMLVARKSLSQNCQMLSHAAELLHTQSPKIPSPKIVQTITVLGVCSWELCFFIESRFRI